MSGFDETNERQMESMAVLRHDEAAADALTGNFLDHLSHTRRRFSGAHDNQAAFDGDFLSTDGEAAIRELDCFVDARGGIRGMKGRFPYLPRTLPELRNVHLSNHLSILLSGSLVYRAAC
jgi:hypothetical protein